MLAIASPSPRRRNRDYDHRLRNAVVATGDPTLFHSLKIAPSTKRTWISRGLRDVVSLDDDGTGDLIIQLARLEKRIARLTVIIALLVALARVRGGRLSDAERLPEGADKQRLLHAITRARRVMPLAHTLRVLGLSPSCYHAWCRREQRCALDDAPNCPRSQPARLTARAHFAMRSLALSSAFAHMSTRALALFAQRQDLVHATAATWYRTIARRGWQRPRIRIHPRPPKLGLRAERPGQFLHVDVTVVRLLDGTRAFVQAVLDNCSRKILAHAVTARYDGSLTASLLGRAFDALAERGKAILFADDGRENRGAAVERALDDAGILQLIAQGHVSFSNSLIEAFWRSLKHGFLFQQRLDSLASLTRFVDFYVHEHNSVMPHSAFQGQTPDEVFFGTAERMPAVLAQQRANARAARIADNQRAHCDACPNGSPPNGRAP